MLIEPAESVWGGPVVRIRIRDTAIRIRVAVRATDNTARFLLFLIEFLVFLFGIYVEPRIITALIAIELRIPPLIECCTYDAEF